MYKEKLIELLKTVPEIKEDLENSRHPMFSIKAITIPLEERHLRMYCNKNKIYCNFDCFGDINLNTEEQSTYKIKLDINKSFHNQSNEVYKAIYEFLYK